MEHCMECDKEQGDIPIETVDGKGSGWKCTCGWWNWLNKEYIMPKSELVVKSHGILSGEAVIEVWYEEELVATVYGADGPGVRVISKHPMDIIRGGLEAIFSEVGVIEGSGG
jgi:hypothetical protein